MRTILITGAAGFIGSNSAEALVSENKISGFDNMNDYYDVSLKEYRLEKLEASDNFTFVKGDLADKQALDAVFAKYKPDVVVNLAAQVGVRYSIYNPQAYISSNIIGFFNILEACRNNPVEHLVYASSSSVYGSNKNMPYPTDNKVDNPVSLYAATKKSNARMAHSYSKLYDIPATGLRFSLLTDRREGQTWHILNLQINWFTEKRYRYIITVICTGTLHMLMISLREL